MVDFAAIAALLDERRPGHALPRALYVDAEAFAFDQLAIHRRSWDPDRLRDRVSPRRQPHGADPRRRADLRDAGP
ncbi:MAG: hypothetical protein WDM85_06765 [Caulobacteraceae bacterium]